MEYVTTWRRLVGWLIEFVIVVALLFAGLTLGSGMTNGSLFGGFVVALTALWLYFAGLESSPRQTTLAGLVLGTRVTDLRGERLSFSRATQRHFAMYLSALTPLAVGYWMVLWTKRKQALHDLVARTLVLRR